MAVQPVGQVWEAMEQFRQRFNDIVPLEMVPSDETDDGLIDKINQCLDADKDLLPELYGWDLSGDTLY